MSAAQTDAAAADVFHPGEQALQARVGARERLQALGRQVVRDHMPDAHRELFGKLPTLLLAGQDADGQPWPTMLCGPPGFVSTPDAGTLRVAAWPGADDPVAAGLVDGVAVGLLALEPHTRRRNRANGRVRAAHEGGFDVLVLQSFGNCPRYIHPRRPEPLAPRPLLPAQRLGPTLDAAALALLRRADTLFIASASAARPGLARGDGVDVSHRAGAPGFVRVHAGPQGLRLTLPDYAGNAFFNTLGNLLQWPRAGLLVVDLEGGGLLQLAADAQIEHGDAPWPDHPGAQRLLHLDVRGGIWRPGALPLRWSAYPADARAATPG